MVLSYKSQEAADNNGLAPLHVNVLKYYLYLQLEKYMYFKDLANVEHQKQ